MIINVSTVLNLKHGLRIRRDVIKMKPKTNYYYINNFIFKRNKNFINNFFKIMAFFFVFVA